MTANLGAHPLPSTARPAPGRLEHAVVVNVSSVDQVLSPPAMLVAAGAGNVEVDTLGGETAVVIAVAAGQLLPLAVTKVYHASTTATGIVALY